MNNAASRRKAPNGRDSIFEDERELWHG